MKRSKYLSILVGFLIFFSRVQAQTENLPTDRPGQTLTPFTMPTKWMQAEVGFSFENFDISGTDKSKFYEHPQVLLKYGIFKNLELRSLTTFATRASNYYGQPRSFTGFSDLQLGFKFKFLEQKSIIPHTSLIVHYMFNSLNGLRAARRDTLDGLHARLAMQHTVSDLFTLNYNVGIEWHAFEHHHNYFYTFSPRFNFLEKWTVFAEVFGSIWDYRSPQHNFGGAVSYKVNDNFRVDAGYNRWRPRFEKSNQFSIGGSFKFSTNKR